MSSPEHATRTSAPLLVGLLLGGLDATVIVASASSLGGPQVEAALFAFAQQLGLGTLVGLAGAAFARIHPGDRGPGSRRRRIGAWLVGVGLLGLLAALTLRADFAARAGKLAAGGPVLPILVAMFAVAAGALATTVALGRRLDALGGRLSFMAYVAPLVGVVIQLVNHTVLSRNYAGVHLWITLHAHALATSALWGRTPVPRRARFAALLAVVAGLAGLVIKPSTPALVELLAHDGDSVAPQLALVRVWARRSVRPLPPAPLDGPKRPHTTPGLGVESPLVVLLTVDCLRADILETDGATLPGLSRLRDRSVRFERAYSTAPATMVSISSLMQSRYFSQQYWVPRVAGGEEFPHEDTTPRLGDVLTAEGVDNVIVVSSDWMRPSYGVAPGFSRSVELPRTHADIHALAGEVSDAVVAELEAAPKGPLFVYAHFLDAHAPYDLSGAQGSLRERYVAELRLVDAAVERLMGRLDASGLAARTIVILTADHGEAFGEHGNDYHGTTLYEEVLRVPLWVALPSRATRSVTGLVSTIDLAPTVVDLIGRDIPSSFMGITLVPTLTGGEPPADRAVVADSGRRLRAMVFPDGTKVIEDVRHGVSELYDLRADPGERNSLYDAAGDARPQLAELQAFFELYELRREGYEPPFRPP